MNLRELVQEFCRRTGLPVPPAVVGTSDPRTLQYWGGMNELCEDLIERKLWQKLKRECVFVSVAGEDQGTFAALTGDPHFYAFVDNTIFDRTQNLRILGGLTSNEWQARKALAANGPLYQFRVRGDRLLFNPELPAGHQIAFEYVTQAMVQSQDGSTFRTQFAADDDIFLFPDRIATAWLRWWWKKEKGLDYAEEFRKYEIAVANLGFVENPSAPIDTGATQREPRPGIIVPEGNWLVL